MQDEKVQHVIVNIMQYENSATLNNATLEASTLQSGTSLV